MTDPRLEVWHAECDAVGIPHDPESLVRHHRNNGILQGSTEMLNAIIGNWKARCAETGENPDWRWMLDGHGDDPGIVRVDTNDEALVGRLSHVAGSAAAREFLADLAGGDQ